MSSVGSGPDYLSHLQRATDNTIFLNILQMMRITNDWLPFDQSRWIREVLHGSSPSESRFAGGLCNELCAYMMSRWVAGSPGSQYLSELDRFTVAEQIVDMADAQELSRSPSDADYLAYLVRRRTGRAARLRDAYRGTTRAADEAMKVIGNCALCMYPKKKGDGHSILVNAQELTLFDPNVGFIRALDKASLRDALAIILTLKYPELHDGVVGLVVCP